jgi:hypothetical protein
MVSRSWTGLIVALTVISMSAFMDAVGGAAGPFPGALWIMVALRATWLLPDWLAKWQRLLERRRPGVADRRDV